MPLKSETVATRSRGDFAYGSSLGMAGGEVVDALSAHIASVLIRIPESNQLAPVALPPVVAEDAMAPPAHLAGSGEKAAGAPQASPNRAKQPAAP
jgi:hypothetical protein